MLENVGEAADFLLECAIGEGADLRLFGICASWGRVTRARADGFAFPDECGVISMAGLHVAVDAVVASVEFAIDEPLGVGRVPVEDFGPGFEPRESSRFAAPESFGELETLFVELLVFVERTDVPVGQAQVGRRGWLEHARFLEEAVDVGLRRGVCDAHVKAPMGNGVGLAELMEGKARRVGR